jgi:apolipoprotein N-acyltransferase
VCILVILGSFVYSHVAQPQGEEVNVLLVQGYVKNSWLNRIGISDLLLLKYEGLTLQHKGEDIDFIFWPEYAIPSDFRVNSSLDMRLKNLSRTMGSFIVLGTFTFVDIENNDPLDPQYDTALVYSPDGKLVDSYYSSRAIGFFNATRDATLNTETIQVTNYSFNVGLCFEEYLNEGNIREDDGDFIAILTNNQHFDQTSGIRLISQFSKLKALEKHKYVVRVTNTGTTQIVNPYGVVEAELPIHQSGTLLGKIYI